MIICFFPLPTPTLIKKEKEKLNTSFAPSPPSPPQKHTHTWNSLAMPACDQSRPTRLNTWPRASDLVIVPSMSEITTLGRERGRG